MNKKKNLFALIFSVVTLLSAFSPSVFAIESDNIIDTDCFYAEIPEDYTSGYSSDGESICFSDDDFNNVKIVRHKNDGDKIKNGIANTGDDELWLLVREVNAFDDHMNGEMSESGKGKVNGLTYYFARGKVYDVFVTDKEDSYYYDFCTYLFATKEYIFEITFEEFCDEYSDVAEFVDVKEILKTVAINGTYFDGESLEKPHQFSNKPFEDVVAETANADFTDEETFILCVVIIVLLVVPTLALCIIATCLIVKHIKRKKIIDEYEIKIGMANVYSRNVYSPNGYQTPYTQNNYGGFNPTGYNFQPTGVQNTASPNFNNCENGNISENPNISSHVPENNSQTDI